LSGEIDDDGEVEVELGREAPRSRAFIQHTKLRTDPCVFLAVGRTDPQK
jgi:hypothetical protein